MKQFLKRGMTLCLTIILVLASVSGCGNNTSDSTDTNTSESTEATESTDSTEENVTAKEAMGMNNTQTEEEVAAIAEAATIEIEALKLVTEWEKKADIALGESITVDGTGAQAKENVVTISEGGSYEITGTLVDGILYVETDQAVKLILNGVNITNSSGPAIYAYSSEYMYIELAKGTENVLADGSAYTENADVKEQETGKGTIFSNDDIIVTGEGSLSVTGNYNHAICSDDMIYFENGSITISAVTDGVHVNDGISLDGGTIEVLSANDGMESEGAMVVNGGSYTAAVADDGISVLGNLTINDGKINITACAEGLEAKNNLVINDGAIEIIGSDDGLNGGNQVQINGGKLYTSISNGDGVDSNGSLEITGGLVVALGGEAPEGGLDCDNNEIIITGGTVIATGGSSSSPSEANSTQATVLLGTAAEGDVIGIQDADGKVVFTFTVSKTYRNMMLSTATIENGKSYTVYTGGTVNGTETFHGYYAEAEYTGGSESVAFTVDSMIVSAGGSTGMQGGGGGGMGGGQKPDNGEMPSDGQMPDKGKMPSDGQMPEGMTPPSDSGQQETAPSDNQLPEGVEQSSEDDSI